VYLPDDGFQKPKHVAKYRQERYYVLYYCCFVTELIKKLYNQHNRMHLLKIKKKVFLLFTDVTESITILFSSFTSLNTSHGKIMLSAKLNNPKKCRIP
jgi:hypothetical protein